MDFSLFQQRRQRVLDSMEEGGVAVLFGAPPNHGRFHQDKDFYYLTGIEENNAILILIQEGSKSVLLLPPKDKTREIWEGPMLGVEGALEAGFQEAYPLEQKKEKLKEALRNRSCLYHTFGKNPDHDDFILEVLKELKGEVREGTTVPKVVQDLRAMIHEHRLIKDEHEIHIMRKAASITARAHRKVMESCEPGLKEYELQAILEYEFRRQGSFWNAFDTIVADGPHALILHYVQNQGVLQDGHLVLVDGGCEYEYYTADISRTLPVNGKFTSPQRQIYDLVWRAQQAVIQMVRPGIPFEALHQKTLEVLTQGLVDLGLLKGDIQELMEQEKYKTFFMHKTGHWMGMDCHDVGEYRQKGISRVLEPGMVFTVEPGLYIPSLPSIPEKFRNIGIRIEDDILVTSEGYEILTGELPSQADEIEAIMSKS